MADKPEHDKKSHEFHIQIDRSHYTVTANTETGTQLRHAVAQPPIADDRDLYQIRPGEPDLLITDADAVKMHDGLRFFTAPRQINPGR